jgi:hypothetical protein
MRLERSRSESDLTIQQQVDFGRKQMSIHVNLSKRIYVRLEGDVSPLVSHLLKAAVSSVVSRRHAGATTYAIHSRVSTNASRNSWRARWM